MAAQTMVGEAEVVRRGHILNVSLGYAYTFCAWVGGGILRTRVKNGFKDFTCNNWKGRVVFIDVGKTVGTGGVAEKIQTPRAVLRREAETVGCMRLELVEGLGWRPLHLGWIR